MTRRSAAVAVALVAVAAVALVGTANAAEVSGDVAYNDSSETWSFNASTTATTHPNLTHRVPYDKLNSTDVEGTIQDTYVNHPDVEEVGGFDGGALRFANASYHNITDMDDLGGEFAVSLALDVDDALAVSSRRVLAKIGTDGSDSTIKITAADSDGDGDYDDIKIFINSESTVFNFNDVLSGNDTVPIVISHDAHWNVSVNQTSDTYNSDVNLYDPGARLGGHSGTPASMNARTVDEFRVYHSGLTDDDRDALLDDPSTLLGEEFTSGVFETDPVELNVSSKFNVNISSLTNVTINASVLGWDNESSSYVIVNQTTVSSAGWINLSGITGEKHHYLGRLEFSASSEDAESSGSGFFSSLESAAGLPSGSGPLALGALLFILYLGGYGPGGSGGRGRSGGGRGR